MSSVLDDRNPALENGRVRNIGTLFPEIYWDGDWRLIERIDEGRKPRFYFKLDGARMVYDWTKMSGGKYQGDEWK